MDALARTSSHLPRFFDEGLDQRSWSEDDYAIVDGEIRVGRINREMIHGRPKWRWFLQTVPGAAAEQRHGRYAGGSC